MQFLSTRVLDSKAHCHPKHLARVAVDVECEGDASVTKLFRNKPRGHPFAESRHSESMSQIVKPDVDELRRRPCSGLKELWTRFRLTNRAASRVLNEQPVVRESPESTCSEIRLPISAGTGTVRRLRGRWVSANFHARRSWERRPATSPQGDNFGGCAASDLKQIVEGHVAEANRNQARAPCSTGSIEQQHPCIARPRKNSVSGEYLAARKDDLPERHR